MHQTREPVRLSHCLNSQPTGWLPAMSRASPSHRSRRSTFKKIDTKYGNAIRAAGGTVDWVNLLVVGIKGNSHMLMQDKNSDQVAEVIQKWLVGKGDWWTDRTAPRARACCSAAYR